MEKNQSLFNKRVLLGTLGELSWLALCLLAGGVVWFVWMVWGVNVVPFDDPYLSDAEYQHLIEQETQMINAGLWVGKFYIASVVTFFTVRIIKVFRAQK
jgi:hypothetical protein